MLTVVAALTVAGASVIDARMIAAVEHAGADISLLDTFGIATPRQVAPNDEATYTTFEGQPLQLSIYRPAGSGSRAPVLVYVHGGGWVSGDRGAHSTDMRWFAEQGWLVVSVDYALSSADRHLWDVTQDQIGCALGWVVDNAPRYGGDPTRLSVSGASAGGNLAINTAYLSQPAACVRRAANHAEGGRCFGDVSRRGPGRFLRQPHPLAGRDVTRDGQRLHRRVSARVSGPIASISSDTHITAAAPPTLIVVGEADHLVPVDGTYRFAELARAVGVDIELVAVPYADHAFDGRGGSIGQQAYRQLTARWLRDHGQGP